jgi:hypothetical protein
MIVRQRFGLFSTDNRILDVGDRIVCVFTESHGNSARAFKS